MGRPDDLDDVRESYDRGADNYVHMVTTNGAGDLRTQPWLKASMGVFAYAEVGRGPVVDVGCGSGAVTGYLVGRGVQASGSTCHRA